MFQNFKCQDLILSLTDLNKIYTKMFAFIRSLLLKVLLLNTVFCFKIFTIHGYGRQLGLVILTIKTYFIFNLTDCSSTVVSQQKSFCEYYGHISASKGRQPPVFININHLSI